MSVLDKDGNEVQARPPVQIPISLPPNLFSKHIERLDKKKILELLERHGHRLFFEWSLEESKKLGQYFKRGPFKPALMSAVVQKLSYPVTLLDPEGLGESWHYDWQREIYTRGTKDFIGIFTKRLFKDDFKLTYAEQTYSDVKYSTELPRAEFVVEPHYIPQKDSILKLYVKNNKWHLTEIPNTPDLYVTSRWDHKYDPNAKNQDWYKYLEDIFHIEDLRFLQEYCGTILWFEAVGIALVLGGPTHSGKSTFGFVLENMLGGTESGNVKSIPPQKFVDTYELYQVFKLPLILVNEFPRAKIEDCSKIKAVITGVGISARTLREAPINFKSFVKIIVPTNDLPSVGEDREAWWNKWQVRIVNKQKFDNNSPDKIDHYERFLTGTQEKRNAIFTWFVDGLLRYLNNGGNFSDLEPWETTREKWKGLEDSLGQFMLVQKGWIYFKDGVNTPKSELYDHYVLFCKAKKAGISPMSKHSFYRAMQRRYIKVDSPIVTDIDPLINGKQVACYGNIGITLPEVERPEERDVEELFE